MGTLSYILREDTWGNGYATEAVEHVTAFAIATAGLERREAMHTPTIRPPAESWPKPVHPHRHFRPARRRRNRRAVPGVCTAVARSSTPLLLITDGKSDLMPIIGPGYDDPESTTTTPPGEPQDTLPAMAVREIRRGRM
ncbi:GNAT family N-acetyltransferase [Streptomyces sp. Edi2]|uniref:GNAT family N-acetyltransferase n=1 Tax=Streptomyces sp. Edi2 TaxID=3162528 RepID=UPI003306552B